MTLDSIQESFLISVRCHDSRAKICRAFRGDNNFSRQVRYLH